MKPSAETTSWPRRRGVEFSPSTHLPADLQAPSGWTGIQKVRKLRTHLCFAGLLAIGAVVYHFPISALGSLVFTSETYSHIPLIPVVSLFLLTTQRRTIFAVVDRRPVTGCAVCAGGLLLYGVVSALWRESISPALRAPDVPNDYLTLSMVSVVAWVIGSFITMYGTAAFRKARFALWFLLFAIPIPTFLLNSMVTSLKYASAQAADIVFGLTGAPYHRVGQVFEFPNVSVQVAEQCSGIRSSLSLFILSIITGFLFLRTFSRRVILALAIFPITVFKNAFRIATVTLLANYLDTRFLTNHWIHQSGGIPFFAVALMMFIPLVWLLRKSEGRSKTGGSRQQAAGRGIEPNQPVESVELLSP
jgi:exosortase